MLPPPLRDREQWYANGPRGKTTRNIVLFTIFILKL